MACISPDGKLSESGMKMLNTLKSGSATPEDVARIALPPLFRVRSGLHELAQAGIVKTDGDKYLVTEKGMALKS